MSKSCRRGVILCLAALLNVGGAATQAPTPPEPIRSPAPDRWDSEIRSALRGDDKRLKLVLLLRAAALPRMTLEARTIKAIGDELFKETMALRAQAKVSPETLREGSGEYAEALTQVLVAQRSPLGLDAIALQLPLALKDFGEAAIPALIRVARLPPASYVASTLDSGDALDALGQILTTQRARLSPASKLAIRQAAAERLQNTRGDDNWRTLGEAAYLAAITGDPQLRQQVEDMLDNDGEFVRRNMSREAQDHVSQYARWGLQQGAP